MNGFNVKTQQRCCWVDITSRVQKAVQDLGLKQGIVQVFVPHTTAGITINEKADPDVARDILARLEHLVPPDAGYLHGEGNSDAHIKTTITGSSTLVPVEHGSLVLGTWQAIFFTEYDGPRNRKVLVTSIPG
jgi:secondary thiamine-phosphate synthase enzyme